LSRGNFSDFDQKHISNAIFSRIVAEGVSKSEYNGLGKTLHFSLHLLTELKQKRSTPESIKLNPVSDIRKRSS
jgi:hypothetical protein